MKTSSWPDVSLLNALRLLPNIRPGRERDRLGECKYRASHSPGQTASINGVPVTLLELEELFLQRKGQTSCISHAGAALLLRLFELGAFDLSVRRPVPEGLALLEQYSKGCATLIGHEFWRRRGRPGPPVPIQKSQRRKSKSPAVQAQAAHRAAERNITVHRLM